MEWLIDFLFGAETINGMVVQKSFLGALGAGLGWLGPKIWDLLKSDTGKQLLGAGAGYGLNQLMGGGQAQQGSQQMDAYARLLADNKRKQMEMAMNQILPQIMANKQQGMQGYQDIRSAYTANRPSSFGMSREDFQPMRGLRGPVSPINIPKINFGSYNQSPPSTYVPPDDMDLGYVDQDDALRDGSYYDEDETDEDRQRREDKKRKGRGITFRDFSDYTEFDE